MWDLHEEQLEGLWGYFAGRFALEQKHSPKGKAADELPRAISRGANGEMPRDQAGSAHSLGKPQRGANIAAQRQGGACEGLRSAQSSNQQLGRRLQAKPSILLSCLLEQI